MLKCKSAIVCMCYIAVIITSVINRIIMIITIISSSIIIMCIVSCTIIHNISLLDALCRSESDVPRLSERHHVYDNDMLHTILRLTLLILLIVLVVLIVITTTISHMQTIADFNFNVEVHHLRKHRIFFASALKQESTIRPVHLLRVFLLRVLESNVPGDSL